MSLFQPAPSSCSVESKSKLVILLARGIVGIGLLYYAFSLLPHSPSAGWGMVAAAIFLLKGCPTCWGMHVVNALRNIRKPSSIPSSEKIEQQRPHKKQYAPKDMADHLFPEEDVNRFRLRDAFGRADDSRQSSELRP